MSDGIQEQEDHVARLLSELYCACAHNTETDSRSTTTKFRDACIPFFGAVAKHREDDKLCKAVESPDLGDLIAELTATACELVGHNDDCEQATSDETESVAHPLTRQSNLVDDVYTSDKSTRYSKAHDVQLESSVSLASNGTWVREPSSIVSQHDGTIQYIVKLLHDLTNSACPVGLVHPEETTKDISEPGSDDIASLLDLICHSACADVPIIHRLLKRRGLSIDQWRRELEDSCMVRPYDDLGTSSCMLGTRPDTSGRVVPLRTTTIAHIPKDKHETLTLPLSQNKERRLLLRDVTEEQAQLNLPCGLGAKHSQGTETITRTLATHQQPPTLRRPSFWEEFGRDGTDRVLTADDHWTSCKDLKALKTEHVLLESDEIHTNGNEHEIYQHDAKRRKWQPLKIQQTPRKQDCVPKRITTSLGAGHCPESSIASPSERKICRKRPAQFSTPPVVRCAEDVLQRTVIADSNDDDGLKGPKDALDILEAPRCFLEVRSINRANDSEGRSPERDLTAVSKHKSRTGSSEIDWSTAAGTVLRAIPRDPRLAAEWQSTSGKPGPDDVTATINVERRRLQAHLADLRKDIEAIELAYKVESQGEDSRLSKLIEKWRSVSQAACDEIYTSTSARLQDLGGFAAWKQMRQGDACREGASGKCGQEDFALTTEEAELMGIAEEGRRTGHGTGDGYTMDHLLAQLDIPLHTIRWDSDAGDWY